MSRGGRFRGLSVHTVLALLAACAGSPPAPEADPVLDLLARGNVDAAAEAARSQRRDDREALARQLEKFGLIQFGQIDLVRALELETELRKSAESGPPDPVRTLLLQAVRLALGPEIQRGGDPDLPDLYMASLHAPDPLAAPIVLYDLGLSDIISPAESPDDSAVSLRRVLLDQALRSLAHGEPHRFGYNVRVLERGSPGSPEAIFGVALRTYLYGAFRRTAVQCEGLARLRGVEDDLKARASILEAAARARGGLGGRLPDSLPELHRQLYHALHPELEPDVARRPVDFGRASAAFGAAVTCLEDPPGWAIYNRQLLRLRAAAPGDKEEAEALEFFRKRVRGTALEADLARLAIAQACSAGAEEARRLEARQMLEDVVDPSPFRWLDADWPGPKAGLRARAAYVLGSLNAASDGPLDWFRRANELDPAYEAPIKDLLARIAELPVDDRKKEILRAEWSDDLARARTSAEVRRLFGEPVTVQVIARRGPWWAPARRVWDATCDRVALLLGAELRRYDYAVTTRPEWGPGRADVLVAVGLADGRRISLTLFIPTLGDGAALESRVTERTAPMADEAVTDFVRDDLAPWFHEKLTYSTHHHEREAIERLVAERGPALFFSLRLLLAEITRDPAALAEVVKVIPDIPNLGELLKRFETTEPPTLLVEIETWKDQKDQGEDPTLTLLAARLASLAQERAIGLAVLTRGQRMALSARRGTKVGTAAFERDASKLRLSRDGVNVAARLTHRGVDKEIGRWALPDTSSDAALDGLCLGEQGILLGVALQVLARPEWARLVLTSKAPQSLIDFLGAEGLQRSLFLIERLPNLTIATSGLEEKDLTPLRASLIDDFRLDAKERTGPTLHVKRINEGYAAYLERDGVEHDLGIRAKVEELGRALVDHKKRLARLPALHVRLKIADARRRRETSDRLAAVVDPFPLRGTEEREVALSIADETSGELRIRVHREEPTAEAEEGVRPLGVIQFEYVVANDFLVDELAALLNPPEIGKQRLYVSPDILTFATEPVDFAFRAPEDLAAPGTWLGHLQRRLQRAFPDDSNRKGDIVAWVGRSHRFIEAAGAMQSGDRVVVAVETRTTAEKRSQSTRLAVLWLELPANPGYPDAGTAEEKQKVDDLVDAFARLVRPTIPPPPPPTDKRENEPWYLDVLSPGSRDLAEGKSRGWFWVGTDLALLSLAVAAESRVVERDDEGAADARNLFVAGMVGLRLVKVIYEFATRPSTGSLGGDDGERP